MTKLRIREKMCTVVKQVFGSNFVLASAGALSTVNPFTASSSQEEIGKAVESYHSREINFKLL
jgi:hypothetical protein